MTSIWQPSGSGKNSGEIPASMAASISSRVKKGLKKLSFSGKRQQTSQEKHRLLGTSCGILLAGFAIKCPIFNYTTGPPEIPEKHHILLILNLFLVMFRLSQNCHTSKPHLKRSE
jgi:hypothetical protein